MKNLIVDYLPFEIKPEQINESMKENNGKLIVRGVLQRAEAKNQNGRIYPREILVREAKKYTKEFIKQRISKEELEPILSSDQTKWLKMEGNFAQVFSDERHGKSLWKVFLLLATVLLLAETIIGRPEPVKMKLDEE